LAVGAGQALKWLLHKLRLACAASVVLSASASIVRAEVLDAQQCRKNSTSAYDANVPLSSRKLTIVAIGSSSTEGVAGNDKSKLYPAAMEASLKKLSPTLDVHVVNKGRGGETMKDTLARFETDVLALNPSLVIWQLGVNDVLRYNGTEGRKQEVQDGLKMLADRHIPVVLLDLQYAPVVLKDPDTGAMQAIINDAVHNGSHAGPHGRVYHFRRFALMKALTEDRKIPVSDMIYPDGLHMSDSMHACVGELLAGMVLPKQVAAAKIKLLGLTLLPRAHFGRFHTSLQGPASWPFPAD
jgi:acyl-CoA thioesterase I